jgi:hypothetical protein
MHDFDVMAGGLQPTKPALELQNGKLGECHGDYCKNGPSVRELQKCQLFNPIGNAGNLTLWYAAIEPSLNVLKYRPRPWFTLEPTRMVCTIAVIYHA